MFNTIQGSVVEALKKYKASIAIEYGENYVTYAQLDKKSDQVADEIEKKGLEKGTFIGIYVENRVEFINIMIGILKAGCVFVPFDINNPLKRIEVMLKKTDIKYMFGNSITVSKLSKGIEINNLDIILVDKLKECDSRVNRVNNEDIYDQEDKIYVFFTSGSTGEPKAIVGKIKAFSII